FTARGNELVAVLVHVGQRLLVRLAELLIRALVEERDALSAGQLANFDAVARLAAANRHAGFVVGDLLVVHVIAQEQGWPADLVPERFAGFGKALATVLVRRLHPDRGDLDRRHYLLLALEA